ncbi:outer membrane autotransporter barrel domain-containing protein [Bartonella sp. A1379B]|uniref:autotransporter family protein n=2 Tax=Bartonella TaxID=773 RepID=UPI00099A7F36|nr:autotransporter outer membrane beta-barrel domain-containing protein [Bartonella sp. A1379B]AQX18609.1 outer membrane autotransporter barrel domain-containing protein [Bartonella sp. A1379B]
MCKNYLLSCTAAAAIILFGAHFNVAAADDEKSISIINGTFRDAGKGKTYEASELEKSALYVGDKKEEIDEIDGAEGTGDKARNDGKTGGTITGEDLTLIGNAKKRGTGATARGSNSKIILKGTTTIKDLDFGLSAGDGGTITMESGTIDVSDTAVRVKGKDTTITLGDVKITSKTTGIDLTDGAKFTMKGGSIEADETAVQAKDKGTTVTLSDVDITSKKEGLRIEEGAAIVANGGSITIKKDGVYENAPGKAVVASGEGTSVTLNDVEISSDNIGIEIEDKAILNMTGGSIKAEKDGVTFVDSKNNKNKLKDTKISVVKGSGFKAEGSTVSLENVSIQSKEGTGLSVSGKEAVVKMTGGTIDAHEVAFVVENGAKIDISNVSATAAKNGLELKDENGDQQNNVNFTNTKLTVEKGVGILGDKSGKDAIKLKNSEIRADLLLKYTSKDDKEASLTLDADHSILEGGVRTEDKAKTVFNLTNGTVWTLKISKEEKEEGADEDGALLDISQRSHSTVSTLNLDNSTIVFDKPTDGQYQILHVGPAIPEVDPAQPALPNDAKKVYNAKGDAKIYFNTEWSSGLKTKDQKTDRLVINGDASGTTTIYVNSIKGKKKPEENASVPANENGLSLVQVSGEANKDSFKLANGYTTINNSPYKYTLNAYGPEDSSKSENQSLFGDGQSYWDFRLQNAYLDPKSKVKALVPQMASYLVMPNALFSAGFSDINQQNASLSNLRIMSLENDNNKKNAFFLSSYGNTATLSSKHTAMEYGYGADLRYSALQLGVALGVLENQNTTTNFGLLGSYGQVSFTPKDMEGSAKSTLDKWSISAFGSIHHRNGLYLDTLFSYGVVKGNIKVADIGNIAKLDDVNTLSASATIGQQFATGVEGLVFEPQAQLAYQRLMFDNISDGNDLEIDMNNPNQWLVRIGGRLTKTVTAAENGHIISLYGKLNMINAFGDGDTIQVADNFHLDPMGTSVEGGVGINAQLNKKLGLHGDVSHQHKLQKAGISATSFSGGIRYRF